MLKNVVADSKKLMALSNSFLFLSIFCLVCAFADALQINSFILTVLVSLICSGVIFVLLFLLIVVKTKMINEGANKLPFLKFIIEDQFFLAISIMTFALFSNIFVNYPVFFSIFGIVFLLSLGIFYIGSMFKRYKEYFGDKQFWFLRILKLFWFGIIASIVVLWII